MITLFYSDIAQSRITKVQLTRTYIHVLCTHTLFVCISLEKTAIVHSYLSTNKIVQSGNPPTFHWSPCTLNQTLTLLLLKEFQQKFVLRRRVLIKSRALWSREMDLIQGTLIQGNGTNPRHSDSGKWDKSRALWSREMGQIQGTLIQGNGTNPGHSGPGKWDKSREL